MLTASQIPANLGGSAPSPISAGYPGGMPSPVPANPAAAIQFDQDTLQKVAQAKAAGYDGATILQKATQYQLSKQAQPAPVPGNPNTLGTKLLDLLPLIGGIGGSFTPLGPIGGGAVGAGLGTLLQQLLGGKQFNGGEVLKQGALAGAGGALGEGLGWAAGKVLPAIAPGLGDVGEKLAAKAFRINPSQATRFAEETGVPFGQFVAERGLTNPAAVDTAIEKILTPFDSVVQNSALTVPKQQLQDQFAAKIAELSNNPIPAVQSQAKVLDQIGGNILNKVPGDAMSAPEITATRRLVDDYIRKFPLDDANKGPLNYTRDILQSSLRDVADANGIKVGDRSLKEAGVELSKLYKVQAIADRQANLGAGSMPLGITNLLAGGAGMATGGPAGAAAAVGTKEALNNPGTLGVLSKILTSLSGAAEHLPQGVSPTTMSTLGRLGVSSGGVLGLPGGQDQSQTQPDMLQNPAASLADTVPTSTGSPTSDMIASLQADPVKAAIAQAIFAKAKTPSDLIAAFKFISPASANAKPLTDTQLKTKASAQSGLRALSLIKNTLQLDPNAPLKAKIPGLKQQTPYSAAAQEMADVLTRLRTGAALNKDEMAFYQNQLPQPLDSPSTIKYKLDLFQNLFTQLATGEQGGATDTTALGE